MHDAVETLNDALLALYDALAKLPPAMHDETMRVTCADVRRRTASLCVDVARLRSALARRAGDASNEAAASTLAND